MITKTLTDYLDIIIMCVYEIERGEKREKKRENEYVEKRQLYKRKTEKEKQE